MLVDSLFSPFIQSVTPAQMVWLAVRVALPSSLRPFWKHLHTHAQRFVVNMILNTIKPTKKVNHYRL